MTRNILLINHYAGSPVHGMEYRPYYLAREWVRQGHRVTIAAASTSHVRQRPPAIKESFAEEWLDGIRYVWLKTPSYQGNGWKRAVNMFSFVGQLYRWQRRVTGPDKLDAVIASSTYPLDIYPARRIARRHRATLVFEVHDLWPLSLIELGKMSPRHPFVWMIQQAEDYAYRHADRVVSILPHADIHMVCRGMSSEKFAYIPNGVDLEEWREPHVPLSADVQQRLASLRSCHKFLVGYAGAMGVANALDNLLDAAALMRDQRVAFVLVGQGLKSQQLERRVAAERLENVAILPAISKAQVPAFLGSVDATFIGWNRCSLYRFGVNPNKLFDYMMAGKPVIHAIDAANDLVSETQCGISVPPEQPREIAAAIKTLMQTSADELQWMGQRGKSHIVEHCDYRVLAEQFISLLDDGVRRSSTPGSSNAMLAPSPQYEITRRKFQSAA